MSEPRLILATHNSGKLRELREILRDMLHYSTNLTAEVVGLAASGAPDALAGWPKVRWTT